MACSQTFVQKALKKQLMIDTLKAIALETGRLAVQIAAPNSGSATTPDAMAPAPPAAPGTVA